MIVRSAYLCKEDIVERLLAGLDFVGFVILAILLIEVIIPVFGSCFDAYVNGGDKREK